MRKFILFTIIAVLTIPNLFAQITDGITYQAVAIDDKGKEIAGMDINGNILHSKSIDVRFSIIESSIEGAVLYQETHETYTDNNGLFSLVIGHGESSVMGTYSKLTEINWGANKLFLKVELDIKSRGEYKVMGIQQMMAVPFAFHSFSSSSVSGENIDTDITNELQTISISNDTIYLSNGGYAKLPENSFNGDYNDLVNKPDLGSFLTTEEDGSVTNELQFLSISNDTIYLSNGGFVKLPASNFSGNFDDLINIPTGIADGDDNTQLTEVEVDAFADNNGYLKTESDPQFGLSEANNITDAGSGIVITDTERTKLNNTNENAEVNVQGDWNEANNTMDAYIANKPNLATVATSGNFSDLANIPTGLADGDDNTQLTEVQVDAYADNNGYIKTESDPQFGLSEANNITDAGSGIVISGTERTKLNNLTEGAEINVQGDWNEANNTSDAYIANKPINLSEFNNDAGFINSSNDIDSTNEIQTLKLSGDTLFISNGNYVILPFGEFRMLSYPGASHTEGQCIAEGGEVHETGSGTICKFNRSDIPSGWTQADFWQQYSNPTADECGRNFSSVPLVFENSNATLGRKYGGSSGAYADPVCSIKTDEWHLLDGSWYLTYPVQYTVNPVTFRIYIGCK